MSVNAGQFSYMERKLWSAEIFYRRMLIIPWKEVSRKMKAKRRVVLKIRRWLNFWDIIKKVL